MRHDSWNLTGKDSGSPTDEAAAHARLAEEFDAWAEAGRGERMEKGHWPTARQALERVPWADVHLFVDIGCGNGYAVRHAAGHMPHDGEAVGIDVSPGMIERASNATEGWFVERQRHGQPAAAVRFQVARFEALPFEPEAVDVVFSNEALYYAPDVDAALAEVVRVLRAGGRFVCGIDFFEENEYSHDWPEKVGVPMVRDSTEGWVERLRAAGLVDVRSERLLDPAGVPDAPEGADEEALAAHEALRRWKTEVGTLLLVGVCPG